MITWVEWLEIGIAVIALFIAFLQYRIDRREARRDQEMKKERERKEKIFQEFSNNIGVINSMSSEFMSFANKLVQINPSGNAGSEIINVIVKYYGSCINKWGEVITVIRRIYEHLLKNETEFSMSYGFERYINCFRVFCQKASEVGRIGADDYNSLIALIKEKKESGEEKFDKTEAEKVDAIYERSISVIKECADIFNEVRPYLDEMIIKYSPEGSNDSKKQIKSEASQKKDSNGSSI